MIDFDHVIDRHGTYCTQWDYVEDRFGEKGLLPFTISDMDIEYSPAIDEALTNRLQHKILGYSRWKHADFQGAVVSWYKRRFDCVIESSNVFYSPSVMYSISKFIELLSNPKEGVLLLTPAYNAFYDVINNNNRRLICSSLIDDNGKYTIDFVDFERKCSEASIFILCSPHNPIGRIWNEDELKEIIRICSKHNVHILSDDIHMDIDYQHKFNPIYKYELPSNIEIVICSSISKSFNVPALSGSYCIIKNEMVRDKFETITRYRDFVNSPAILHIIATIAAYEESEEWLEELLIYLKKNLDYTKDYLKDNIPELYFEMPEGCYFAWINFKQLHITSSQFQEALIHIGKVAIMPGNSYGIDGEFYLRFHVGCSLEKVKEGLERIKKTVEYVKENY
ncbi:MAG: aminotransferase class I/II-fold pyridoxal phosphate-dependent enzyme [Bacilli bacterium]